MPSSQYTLAPEQVAYQASQGAPAPAPVRCYEDGSCDPPGTTYNADGTKSYAPVPESEAAQTAILADLQYGLEQRKPPLKGLFGGG